MPFLHFLIRSGGGRNSSLLSPLEAGETSAGASFFAPLRSDGRLHPHYRFHFSIYLGEGTFLEDGHKKVLFTGVGAAPNAKRSDDLVLIFGVPGPERWLFPQFFPPFPKLLEREEEFFIPILRRTPGRRPAKYAGDLSHPDFKAAFAELQPAEPQVLDRLLGEFGISMIGCDPHTKYERAQKLTSRGRRRRARH